MRNLPKLQTTPRGFTMVELLVVIAIIAILAVAGIALFGSAPQKARDTKRRADVNALAKAMELKFDATTGEYSDPATLADSDFASGTKPVDPKKNSVGTNPSYVVTQWSAADKTKFRVCADLEGAGVGWDGTQADYCQSGAQGTAVATVATCANFKNQAVGTTQTDCRTGSFSGTIANGQTIYMKCSDLSYALDCADTSVCRYLPSGAGTFLNWYSSDTAVSTSGTVAFWTRACGGTSVTVQLRS